MQKEGFRRLSVLVGGVCCFTWFVVVFGNTEAFTDVGERWSWWTFIASLLVTFFVPMLFVRGIGWVVAGFKDHG